MTADPHTSIRLPNTSPVDSNLLWETQDVELSFESSITTELLRESLNVSNLALVRVCGGQVIRGAVGESRAV